MKLLDLGASPGLSARAAPRIRPRLLQTQYLKKLSGIPPLLSPLLGNSPCTSNLHVQIPRRSARYQEDPPEFQVSLSDHVIRTNISPLVDRKGYILNFQLFKLFFSRSLWRGSTDLPTKIRNKIFNINITNYRKVSLKFRARFYEFKSNAHYNYV